MKDGIFKTFKIVWHFPRKIMVFLISIYQRTISSDHGGILKVFYPYGYCRFTPSCSEYSKQAFLKYGFVKGLFKSAWRILRCNPWNKGGHDAV